MPITSTPSHGFTIGAGTSLTISHTSDSNPLYVLLSWWVGTGGIDDEDRVTGITYDGVALTRGGHSAEVGNTMEWWRLETPTTGTHDVVITLGTAKRITAGVLNLSGWPIAISDHTFIADGASADPPPLDVPSRAGAEILSWIGFNHASQDVTIPAGATELWNEEGMNVTGGGPSDGDQRSAGSIQLSAAETVTLTWAGTEDSEFFGVAALSFTGTVGHHLVAGSTHAVSGADNVACGRNNTVRADGSQTHGEHMTVTGNRAIGVNLTNTPETLSDDNTLEVWADAIRLHGLSIPLDDLVDVDITSPEDGDLLTYDSASSTWINTTPSAPSPLKRVVGITIDGGGSVISTGAKAAIVCPFSGTISKWTLLSDDVSITSGSITIDVWKAAFASYPPTIADTITGGNSPALTGATSAEDATLSGWTTSVTAGDVFRFNVDDVEDLTRVTLVLEIS